MHENLDLEVLRTFVCAVETGNFARAAARVGRSASAVSLQMQRLEEQAGQRLFVRPSRDLQLTDAGDVLLGHARRLLDANDRALTAVRGVADAGTVRLGLPQDFAESWLPSVLAQFARSHPAVHVEVQVERNAALLDRLARGQLDLSLVFGAVVGAGPVPSGTSADQTAPVLARSAFPAPILPSRDAPLPAPAADGLGEEARCDVQWRAAVPIAWVVPEDFRPESGQPLPLVLFEPPCLFREATIGTLEQAGLAWRLAFTSPSLAGLWAAVSAGLGVTARVPDGVDAPLRAVRHAASLGLPDLPSVELSLRTAQGGTPLSAAALRLRDILREVLRARTQD